MFLLSDEIHFNHFGKDVKLSLAVKDLILHLSRVVYELVNPHAVKEQQGLFEKLIDYINEHLEEDLSLERLAKLFFANKYHIAHVERPSKNGVSFNRKQWFRRGYRV